MIWTADCFAASPAVRWVDRHELEMSAIPQACPAGRVSAYLRTARQTAKDASLQSRSQSLQAGPSCTAHKISGIGLGSPSSRTRRTSACPSARPRIRAIGLNLCRRIEQDSLGVAGNDTDLGKLPKTGSEAKYSGWLLAEGPAATQEFYQVLGGPAKSYGALVEPSDLFAVEKKGTGRGSRLGSRLVLVVVDILLAMVAQNGLHDPLLRL
eukprot:scaffold208027_cov39-Prasinocladus_malaysianus.AAC.1